MKKFGFAAVLVFVALAGCASLSETGNLAARAQLAPSGILRVGVVVAPRATASFAAKNPVSGQVSGPAVDLGKELAQQLGVPFELTAFSSPADLTKAGPSGAWDIAFLVVDPERRAFVDFGPAYSTSEITYLVPARSTIFNIAEVDRHGVRVAAIEGSVSHRVAKSLSNATVIGVKTVEDLYEMARSDKADAVTAGRVQLTAMANTLPGARVLSGAAHSTGVAIAVPRNRPQALAFVTRFTEHAKATGSVQRAFERAGLKDTTVAPPLPP